MGLTSIFDGRWAILTSTRLLQSQYEQWFAAMGLTGSQMEAQAIGSAGIQAAGQAYQQALSLAQLGFQNSVAAGNINSDLSRTGMTGQQTGTARPLSRYGVAVSPTTRRFGFSRRQSAMNWR
mgnify:CR=1 FL=1